MCTREIKNNNSGRERRGEEQRLYFITQKNSWGHSIGYINGQTFWLIERERVLWCGCSGSAIHPRLVASSLARLAGAFLFVGSGVRRPEGQVVAQ